MEPEDYCDDYDEYQAGFEGSCTCEHAPDEHGWGSCSAYDPDPVNLDSECPCEAGWVE